MCLAEEHFFSIDQLLDLLRDENPNNLGFLGVDFNSWEPHVATTIHILSLLASKGFPCFYIQKEFGLLPQYGKPYFGKNVIPSRDFLESFNLERLELQSAQTNFILISECEKESMLSDLLNTANGKELSKLKHKEFDFGYAILSTICSMYGKGEISKSLIRRIGPKVLENYVEIVNAMCFYLKTKRIKYLVVFNGRFVNEKAAVSAARHLGVKIIFHEALRDNSFHISCFSPHSIIGYRKMSESLTFKVEEDFISKESELWYQSRLKGLNLGTAQFQKKWGELENLSLQNLGDHKRISIFTTSDDEYLGISSDWDLPEKQSQREWISLIAKLALKYNYQVTLRLHPNLKTKSKSLQRDWNKLSNIEGLKVIGFTDNLNSYNLVMLSDLVITCGSTIAMEAGYLGKPVLSVGTGIYDSLDAVKKIQDLDLIEEHLRSGDFDYFRPERRVVDRYGYVEKNKFTAMNLVSNSNFQNSELFLKPSFFNKVCSKIYRELVFKFF